MMRPSAAAEANYYAPIVHWISADGLRNAGYEGQGVRVGVISDGASNYSNLERAGILPPKVVTFGEKQANRGDEADWMLQIVHQIAPQAKLAFCYYKLGLATCVKKLIKDFHANVIVSDFSRRTTKFSYSKEAVLLAKLHREYPNVLLFAGDGNNSGNFYRGKWKPVPWKLNGAPVLAQNFGASTNQPSQPYNVIRIWKGSVELQIRGHVHEVDPRSPCQHLPVRLVLLSRYNHVIASTNLDYGGDGRNSLQLIVNSKQYPAISKETIYHVALVSPLSFEHVKFRIRLMGLAVLRAKPRHTPFGNRNYYLQVFKWRYATGGTAAAMVGAASKTGYISVVPLDPYTSFRGKYAREDYAGVGPACYLPSRKRNGNGKRLFCYQQPLLAAPVMASVARPAHNTQGYAYRPFPGGSAAGPPVAGATALLLSAGVPAKRIVRLLERTSAKWPNQHRWSPFYGYGQIEVDAAARAAGVLPKRTEYRIGLMPASYGYELHKRENTGVKSEDATAVHRNEMKKLARTAEVGSPEAMWELANNLNEGRYYPKHDFWAALTWWQRAAKRGYPNAFCSLGAAYANAGLSLLTAFPPIPYRPRLALALFDACKSLGGSTKKTSAAIEKLQLNLSAHDIASAETLARHLAHDPIRYLPSLNYEYVPPSQPNASVQ